MYGILIAIGFVYKANQRANQQSKCMSNWISVSAAREEAAIGPDVEVRGWVRTRRDSKGGFSFIEVNDGSCFGNLQIVALWRLSNYADEVQKLTAGCSVVVPWRAAKSHPPKVRQRSCMPTKFACWAGPIRKLIRYKRNDIRSRNCASGLILRPRTNTFGAVARVRNQICQSIHQFFHEYWFLLHQHADHHGQRLRRCRGDVSRHRVGLGDAGQEGWAGQLLIRLL